MKTGTIVAIIIILFIGIVAFVWLSNGDDNVAVNIENALDDSFQNATTTDTERIGNSWQTYENESYPFTFSYPEEASVGVEADRVVVTYIGPDSTPNSEISDGFTFTVETQDKDSSEMLQEFAEDIFTERSESLQVVASTSATTVGSANGYEFQVESELGTTVTYVVFQASDQQAFIVSYSVADPARRGYDGIIDQMLNSLQYDEASETTATTTP